ncbi:MAG: TolC family protein [Bdellovibrionales bacterium]|nr:TolC family protein [Bdellovibrionales bacterium]
MEYRFWHLILTFFIFITGKSLLASEVVLSPQEVIEQIVTTSSEVELIKLNESSSLTNVDKAYAGLDWLFESSIHYEDSKEVNLSAIKNEKDETLSYNLGFNKMFSTGTKIDFSANRQSRRSILNPFIANNNPGFSSSRTADLLSLSLSQELWRNAFGVNFHKSIHSGRLNATVANFKKLEDLEELTLQALKLYWDTFVAKESLLASLSSQKRFEELTNIIRSKAKLGYSNPGELNISLAELEEKNQKVKKDSVVYLEKTRELFRLLKKEVPQELTFKINKEILPPEDLPSYDLNELRSIKALIMNFEILDNSLKIKKNNYQPQLQLIAAASYTGADETPEEAWSQALGGDKPIYSIGLNLNIPIYSRSTEGELKETMFERDKIQVQLKINKDKLRNQILSLHDLVNANYMIAQSYFKSFEFRKKAAQQIERAFRQGRSDINTLVQTYNALSDTETKKIRSLGDYHVSINSLAAALDLLVKSQFKEIH